MRRRTYNILGEKIFPINTIIGGVGTTITTKTILASTLGISESLIRRFEIIGSDVHCNIRGEYAIKRSAFSGNNDITSYIDIDNICTMIGISAFQNATNLKNIKANRAGFESSAFLGATNLSNEAFGYEYFTNSNQITGGIQDCKFKIFNAPNATTLTNEFARNNSTIQEVITAVTIVPNYAFANTTMLSNFSNLNNLTTLSSASFLNSYLPGSLNFEKVTYFLGGISGLMSNAIHFPSLIEINSKTNQFQNLTNLTILSAKKLKIFGDASVQSGAFNNLKLGCIIEIHISLATSNSGNPDAALLYAKNNRQAIVKFYDDNGNYVSTL